MSTSSNSPVFDSGWSNYGSGNASLVMKKNDDGLVTLTGLIKWTGSLTANAEEEFATVAAAGASFIPGANIHAAGFAKIDNKHVPVRIKVTYEGFFTVLSATPGAVTWVAVNMAWYV